MVVDASVLVSGFLPHDVHDGVCRGWLFTLDEALSRAAADLAARLRLRAGDAVYIATAALSRLPLVSWDTEQRKRGRPRRRGGQPGLIPHGV